MNVIPVFCLGTESYQAYIIPSEAEAIRHVEETGKPNVCMPVEYEGMMDRINSLIERVKQNNG